MDIKEAVKTIQPVLMALNEVTLKVEELALIEDKLAETKAQVDDADRQLQSAVDKREEARKAQEDSDRRRIEARNTADQMLVDARAKAKAIIADAENEAKLGQDRIVIGYKNVIERLKSDIEATKEELANIEKITRQKLEKHKEVEDSLNALKARL